LTLQEVGRKSNRKVSIISPGLYAQWRARTWAGHTLAERPDGLPLSEQLLQLIWQHQRLRRDQLLTTDGQPVKVLHPGFWNHESGPDFLDAIVQFGEERPLIGDIEIDLSPQNWHAHGHDQNRAYRRVILHVVWEAEAQTPRPLATLELKNKLDAPVNELSIWLRNEATVKTTSVLGQCFNPLRALPQNEIAELLQQAAEIRLRAKAGQFQARAKQVGWEAALWEGLFGALGYKHNAWAMQRVAELLTLMSDGDKSLTSPLAWQARLLGVAGLLPTDTAGPTSTVNAYLRKLWDVWWRDRERFCDLVLPPSLWRLNGLRPANNPQRRLSLAAHWLARGDLPNRLEQWFASAQPGSKAPMALWQLLQTADDAFWSRHWTFRSLSLPEPQPLIGLQRVTDLAVNVILPWFWVRASVGQNTAWQRRAEECYFAWPKAEDNAVLRLARRRFFGSLKLAVATTAATQQGLLQIVRDFCDYSNALCQDCQFPSFIQQQQKMDRCTP
jgi:hypothetical protein